MKWKIYVKVEDKGFVDWYKLVTDNFNLLRWTKCPDPSYDAIEGATAMLTDSKRHGIHKEYWAYE